MLPWRAPNVVSGVVSTVAPPKAMVHTTTVATIATTCHRECDSADPTHDATMQALKVAGNAISSRLCPQSAVRDRA
jgi:hypothetical protein